MRLPRRKFFAKNKKYVTHIKRRCTLPSLNDGLVSGEVWFGFAVAEGFALNILTVTMARYVFSSITSHKIITAFQSIPFEAEKPRLRWQSLKPDGIDGSYAASKYLYRLSFGFTAFLDRYF